jgi:plastocyanin
MRIIPCTTLIVLAFVTGCTGAPPQRVAPPATPAVAAGAVATPLAVRAPVDDATVLKAPEASPPVPAATISSAGPPPPLAASGGAAAVPKPPGPTPSPAAVAPPRPALARPSMAKAPAPAAAGRATAPVAKAPATRAATPAPVAKDASVSVRGRLELGAGPRQAVDPGEVAEGLVYFLPDAGTPAPRPGRFTIATHSKGFSPNLLVVPVGSTVSFPNQDSILHNVYSRTPGNSFDLATYGPGETRQTVFSKAGLVIVNCNVHHAMRANVVVLATPYHVRPGKDGSFLLKNLPEGPGTLVFWHPRASPVSLPLKSGGAPVVQRLLATKARIDAHAGAR